MRRSSASPGMGDRVVEVRVLGDRREQRRLGRVDVFARVPEVDAAGLLDAVGAVAEVDRVQVGGQDPVLRPDLLELPGERRLAQLARDRRGVAVVGVLDELLGDRRAALDGAAVGDVGPERAQDAAQVDPAVLVEALVLDRDDRVLDPGRDVGRGDDRPAPASRAGSRGSSGRRSRRRSCSPACAGCRGRARGSARRPRAASRR